MDELATLLLQSILRLLPTLETSPHELASRLARRSTPTVTRPPRAWCLAVRASDTRITPTRALIDPPYAVEPLYRRERLRSPRGRDTRPCPVQSHIPPHTVTLTSELLAHLCPPVSVPYGLTPREAAPLLGTTEAALARLRTKDLLHFDPYPHLHGRRGHPVPMLTRSITLDPSSTNLRSLPDPLWLLLWQYQTYQIPRDIDQTVARHALYRNRPNPGRLATSHLCFRGFTWLCPACHRPARTLYYPLPPISLPQLHKPLQRLLRPHAAAHPSPPLPATRYGPTPSATTSFACHHCHRVRYFTRIGHDSWNQLISHLTSGLLYGREVPKPASFTPTRKRAYRPNLNRPPSQRREQVLQLLTTTPLTYDQIAAKLGVGYTTVHNHTKTLYKQHNVHTRQALTLAVAPDTPLSDLPPKHPAPKRNEVLRLHLAGLRRAQIAHQTGLSPNAVSHHLKVIRRQRRAWQISSAEHLTDLIALRRR